MYDPVGMEPSDAESFKQDDVLEYVNEKFADPYVGVTTTPVSKDDECFIVIQVQEFGQLAVICKKDDKEGVNDKECKSFTE